MSRMDDKKEAVKVDLLSKLSEAGRPPESLSNLLQVVETSILDAAIDTTALNDNVIPVMAGDMDTERQQLDTLKRNRAQVIALQTPGLAPEQTLEKE